MTSFINHERVSIQAGVLTINGNVTCQVSRYRGARLGRRNLRLRHTPPPVGRKPPPKPGRPPPFPTKRALVISQISQGQVSMGYEGPGIYRPPPRTAPATCRPADPRRRLRVACDSPCPLLDPSTRTLHRHLCSLQSVSRSTLLYDGVVRRTPPPRRYRAATALARHGALFYPPLSSSLSFSPSLSFSLSEYRHFFRSLDAVASPAYLTRHLGRLDYL
jgi:hypothetical protein